MEAKGKKQYEKVSFPKDCNVKVLKVQTQEKASGTPVEGEVEVPILTSQNQSAVLRDFKSVLVLAQLQLDTYAMNWRRVQLVEDPVKLLRKAIADKLKGLSADALAELEVKFGELIGLPGADEEDDAKG